MFSLDRRVLFLTIVEGLVSEMNDFSEGDSFIEAAFYIIFGLSFFFSIALNRSFYNLEKGTSTNIVPMKPKHILITAIPPYKGMTSSAV